MHHITRILYLALCVSGLVSGAFLLLCCFGVVDPALLFQREDTAVLPTSAPAEVPQPEEAAFRKALQELSAGSLAPETTGTELRGVRIR